MSDLDPMDIGDAIDLYLDAREEELSENTHRSHRYRLQHIKRWAKERDDIATTDNLSGRKLWEYRRWRREDGDLNTVSLHTQLSTVKVWLQWLEKVDAAPADLYEKLDIPTLDDNQERSDEALESEVAADIDMYLERYEYASRDHALWTLLYGTGMRLGSARSIDLDDFNRDERQLRLVHREETGTPLKNGGNGERVIAISAEMTQRLADYVDNVRPEVTDDHGRKPLIATEHGRPSTATLRRAIYRWTQPCQRGEGCPHDRTVESCEAAGYTNKPTGCPSMRPPHAIRKRVIVDYRKDEIPDAYISDRADVSTDVMDKHYDVRSDNEKAEDRRDWFE